MCANGLQATLVSLARPLPPLHFLHTDIMMSITMECRSSSNGGMEQNSTTWMSANKSNTSDTTSSSICWHPNPAYHSCTVRPFRLNGDVFRTKEKVILLYYRFIKQNNNIVLPHTIADLNEMRNSVWLNYCASILCTILGNKCFLERVILHS